MNVSLSDEKAEEAQFQALQVPEEYKQDIKFEHSKKCGQLELALKRCELQMGNKTEQRIRNDMRKSLIYQMLKITNFKAIVKK